MEEFSQARFQLLRWYWPCLMGIKLATRNTSSITNPTITKPLTLSFGGGVPLTFYFVTGYAYISLELRSTVAGVKNLFYNFSIILTKEKVKQSAVTLQFQTCFHSINFLFSCFYIMFSICFMKYVLSLFSLFNLHTNHSFPSLISSYSFPTLPSTPSLHSSPISCHMK